MSDDAVTSKHIVLYSPSRRVKLETPTAEFDEAVAILRTEPGTRKYLLGHLPATMTMEESKERRESRSKDPKILDFSAYVRQEDGSYELGGSTGVFNIDTIQNTCEAGILVATKYQGKGVTAEIFYALWTYLFEERGFHRVTLETAMENAPMRGWLERVAGVRQEGTKIECWADKAGGWTDVASYALLEREWKASIKARLEKRIADRK
ncbi:hypothetical protein D9611_003934 [Ephemerocybe angulata]|uniref:N-acetyltransferase domain-containing protein n=1 Tax=Ephemerocybe angulata TaxID=980116 RepID=A0A8H5B6E6_9AGAR|nr:hypothetical protein D9611_003934 [Tulosesus angulatus]